MTCAEVQAALSLYLYGELDFAAEETVENHLEDCALCQLALNREKEWHAAVNRQQRDVSPEWLAACRGDLYGRIAAKPSGAWTAVQNRLEAIREFFDFRITGRSYRLAGVSFLLMIGFGVGRMMNSVPGPWTSGSWTSGNFANAAGLIEPAETRVQEIRPESGNRVSIIVQRVQIRQISGNRSDDGVRSLLVGAARESADPGVRMDSVEMLAGQSGSEIRNAIVSAIKNDPSAAVRVKAVELLRQFPADPVTREALESALAHDTDPGVRTEAMDVLVPAGGAFQVTPQLVQTLNDVMQSAPDDEYLRLRCAQILKAQVSAHGVY